jgi:hypothetical protein
MPVSWAQIEGGIRADAYTIDRMPRPFSRLKRKRQKR